MDERARRRSIAVAWLVLGAVLVGIVVWAVWPSGSPTVAERAHDLAAQLRCPDCESLSAADSHTASARAIRRDLRDRIAEGQSDAEIRRAYVERYGESILLEPERDGLGMIVWGLPVLLVTVAAIGLGVTLWRWGRMPALRPSDDDEALVREERTRAGSR